MTPASESGETPAQALDPALQQRLLVIQEAIRAAGESQNPEQALPIVAQAQVHLQEVLDEYSGHAQ